MTLDIGALLILIPDDGIEVDALHLAIEAEFPAASGVDLHRALIQLDFRGLASEYENLIVRRTRA